MSDYREHYELSKKRQMTFTVDEDLMRWVRQTAAGHGVPISTVFEVALRHDAEARRRSSGIVALHFEGDGLFACQEPGCGGIAATWASLNLEDVASSWADLKLYFQCHKGHYTLLYLKNAEDGTIRYRVERVTSDPPEVEGWRLSARPTREAR